MAALDLLERAAARMEEERGPARASRDARAAPRTRSGARRATARGSIVTSASRLAAVGRAAGPTRSGVTVSSSSSAGAARAARAPAAPRAGPRPGSPRARARRAAGRPRRGRSCRPRGGRRAGRARRRPRRRPCGRRLLLRRALVALLGDELFLAARELDPVLQLVLRDRALLLDASARRANGASSACCWIASRVGWRSAFSTSAVGVTAATRTATTSRPSSASAGSSARPAAIRSRIGATPPVRIVRRSRCTSSSMTNCWASWVSSAATCSSGAWVQRPDTRSIVKSTRSASRGGSATRNAIAPCTVSS